MQYMYMRKQSEAVGVGKGGAQAYQRTLFAPRVSLFVFRARIAVLLRTGACLSRCLPRYGGLEGTVGKYLG
jgi:hypothetical protein